MSPLFIMYTADLLSLTQQHHLSPHLYADDTQIYGGCVHTCSAADMKLFEMSMMMMMMMMGIGLDYVGQLDSYLVRTVDL